MSCLYHEEFASGLGGFELALRSSHGFVVEEPGECATTLLTVGHRVTIRSTPAPTAWLPAGMEVSYARAWLFYLHKRNPVPEQLTFSFRLTKPSGPFDAGPHTGQDLMAIELENGVRQLHIGTEDEDVYGSSWVPERLQKSLCEDLIINYIEPDGLTTVVPELLAGEQFYFHYIVAESPRRKSTWYPDEWDISTWYAVDQGREKLEEAWRQRAKKPPQ